MDDCSAGLRAEDKSVLCGHRRSRQQIVTKRPSVVYRPTLILYAQATPYATCRPTKTHMERLGDWQKRQTYRWSRDQQIMRSVNLYLGYRLILIWYKSTAALAVTSLSLSFNFRLAAMPSEEPKMLFRMREPWGLSPSMNENRRVVTQAYMSSLSSWTSMRRRRATVPLANGREAARCGEWVISNASCFLITMRWKFLLVFRHCAISHKAM